MELANKPIISIQALTGMCRGSTTHVFRAASSVPVPSSVALRLPCKLLQIVSACTGAVTAVPNGTFCSPHLLLLSGLGCELLLQVLCFLVMGLLGLQSIQACRPKLYCGLAISDLATELPWSVAGCAMT